MVKAELSESKMRRTFVTFLVLVICQASFLLGNEDENHEVNLKYRLPAGIVKPMNYKLHITPNLEDFSFEGEVDITLKALTNNDTLVLNSKELHIESIAFRDLNTTDIFVPTITLEETYETMTIKLDRPFKKDHHFTLSITYFGILNDYKKGFYRSSITESEESISYMAVTHFQPTSARLAFPCWDEPIYKATFFVALTHKKGLMAISNMREESQKEEANGMVTTSFKETKLMPTYLLAFAVGDYVSHEDASNSKMLYRIWTKKSLLNLTDYALDMGRRILEELNAYTCILYHISMNDKLDQIGLEDFTVSAMENWGLVTYREDTLLYDKHRTTSRMKIVILTIIAHELSHQWFGNLVSPKMWRHVWLSEGIATYLQYVIGHKVEPELRLNDMYVVEHMQALSMVFDAEPVVIALNHDASTPTEISALFENVIYHKGSSVIHMIEKAMPEEVFKDGLNKYLDYNMYGSVDPDDLFEGLQEAMDKTKNYTWKVPVKQAMKEWVEKPGYPLVTVQRVKGGYRLKQEHFVVAMIKIREYDTKWWIPITYVEQSNPDFSNTIPVDWFDPSNETHFIKTKPQPGWFIFNTQQAGYYRVNYDIENWKLLTEELKKGKYSKIHVLNRAQLIDDVINIPLTNRLDYAVAMNLTLFLRHETDYMVWQTAFRHLRIFYNMFRTSKQFYTFKRYMTYLMRGVIKDVGFEPRANDTDLIKILRVHVFKWSCELGVKSCIKYAEREFYRWLENPETRLDVNLDEEILCAGVRNANESIWQKTRDHLHLKFVEESVDLMLPLACSNSTKILKEYLKSTTHKNSTLAFPTIVEDIVARNSGGPEIVFRFMIEEYEKIRQLEQFESTINMATMALGNGITHVQQLLNLTAFLLDRKLSHALEGAIKAGTENMIWIERHRSTVEKWLAANSKLFEIDEDSSASSMAIGSFLVIFSLFITRFY